ncbi:hypothetical protein D3C85_1819000 [compost metagenome]
MQAFALIGEQASGSVTDRNDPLYFIVTGLNALSTQALALIPGRADDYGNVVIASQGGAALQCGFSTPLAVRHAIGVVESMGAH